MIVEYTSLRKLSPPRAEKAVTPGMLPLYERLGWVAQFKKNGTYSVVYVSPTKEVTTTNRHLDPHSAWVQTEATDEAFRRLPGRGWWVVCAELLHSKVPGIRNVQYVHDVLVADGEWLLGLTYAQRYALVQTHFHRGAIGDTESHWVMPNGIWVPKNHRSGFRKLFDSIWKPEDEGLVLKDPRAVLTPGAGRGWTVKCRHPNKNLSF